MAHPTRSNGVVLDWLALACMIVVVIR